MATGLEARRRFAVSFDGKRQRIEIMISSGRVSKEQLEHRAGSITVTELEEGSISADKA